MTLTLTKKDIIALNQRFDAGKLHNEASLDFALSYCKRSGNWTKGMAYLVRAILADHVFGEGNKRTALLLISTCADMEGHETYDDVAVRLIKGIIDRKITDINKIEEMIHHAIKSRK